MEDELIKAECTNLPRINTLMAAKLFTCNQDFCSAELRNVKTSIMDPPALPELPKEIENPVSGNLCRDYYVFDQTTSDLGAEAWCGIVEILANKFTWSTLYQMLSKGRKTRVTDIAQQISKLKWQCAGHIALRTNRYSMGCEDCKIMPLRTYHTDFAADRSQVSPAVTALH